MSAFRLVRVAFAVVALAFACCGTASAQFSVDITVDENCDGTLTNSSGFFSPLPCALLPDPGPGGVPAAVTYSLLSPPGLVAGDLLLFEPLGLSEIIRFNPQQNGGSLVFYSDNFFDGVDAQADVGFPDIEYANNLSLSEVGPEGANGIAYTPTAGEPGFVAGAAGPVTYDIHSDSPVPEPTTLALLGIGLAGLGFSRRQRKQ